MAAHAASAIRSQALKKRVGKIDGPQSALRDDLACLIMKRPAVQGGQIEGNGTCGNFSVRRGMTADDGSCDKYCGESARVDHGNAVAHCINRLCEALDLDWKILQWYSDLACPTKDAARGAGSFE